MDDKNIIESLQKHAESLTSIKEQLTVIIDDVSSLKKHVQSQVFSVVHTEEKRLNVRHVFYIDTLYYSLLGINDLLWKICEGMKYLSNFTDTYKK